MVAELRLDRALNGADVGAEYDLVELGHHHAGAELPEIPATLAGRARRMLLRQFGEIRAALNLIFQ